MSEVARELQMLFYLDKKYKNGNPYVKISELADLFEISERQVRRYRDDLEQNGFYIENKFGPDGGYRLMEGLDKSLMIPDNIMLALGIAARKNDSLLKALHDLPVVPAVKRYVDGDALITDHQIEVSSIVSQAIAENKRVHFDYDYRGKKISVDVEPYRILNNYHTYYLRGVSLYNKSLRKYDVDKISGITLGDSFTPDSEIIKKVDEDSLVFGILDDDKPNEILHLRFYDSSDALTIDRYFEYKGVIDKENKIYTVTIKPTAEAFYNLFALHNKCEILDEGIKRHYINYMKDYLKMIE